MSTMMMGREIDAALQRYWEKHGAEPGEEAGNKIARVRELVTRVSLLIQELQFEMLRLDVKKLRAILTKLGSVDRKYPGNSVEDIIQDVWDVVEAIEEAGTPTPTQKEGSRPLPKP